MAKTPLLHFVIEGIGSCPYENVLAYAREKAVTKLPVKRDRPVRSGFLNLKTFDFQTGQQK